MRVWDQVDPRLLTEEQALVELYDVIALHRVTGVGPTPVIERSPFGTEIERFIGRQNLLVLRHELLLARLPRRTQEPSWSTSLRTNHDSSAVFDDYMVLIADDAITGDDPNDDRWVTQSVFKAIVSRVDWPATDMPEAPWL